MYFDPFLFIQNNRFTTYSPWELINNGNQDNDFGIYIDGIPVFLFP